MHVILKNKIYRRIAISNFVSKFGDGIFYVALLTFASKLPNPGFTVSIATFSEQIPGLSFLFVGIFADRVVKKSKSLLFLCLTRCILYALVAFFIGLTPALWVVVVISIINIFSDTCGNYYSMLLYPFTPEILDKDSLAEGLGAMNAITMFSGIISNFFGAIFVGLVSFSLLATINAVSFLFAGAIILSIIDVLRKIENKEFRKKESTGNFYEHIKKASLDLKRPRILNILIQGALATGISNCLSILILVSMALSSKLIIKNYQFSVFLIQSMFALGSFFGGLFVVGKLKKFSPEQIIPFLFFISFLNIVALKFSFFIGILALSFLGTCVAAASSAKLSATIIEEIPKQRLASIGSVFNFVVLGFSAILTTLITTILNVWSIDIAIYILSFLCIFCIVLNFFMTIWAKKIK